MSTIEDVAKLAGVSKTTVSRVLNDHPYVAEGKKALVQKAMEELLYVPNSTAQRLRKQTTQTIAVLIPRISNPFFSKMVEVMENMAADHGLQLVVCQTMYDKQRELVYLDLVKTKQIDGVILASLENDWEDVKDYTNFAPIIFCNEYDDRAKVPTVRLNQFEGAYIGTKHLIEKGYRKIAKCRGANLTGLVADRQRGFFQALDEAGLSFDNDWMFLETQLVEDGRKVLRKMLSMKNRPDAVFTGSDEVAAGIISEAARLHVKIPDELAVLGFDNQQIAALVNPGLTTIHQPIDQIGKLSIKVMIDLLHGEGNVDKHLKELPIYLVERSST
ncbi:LacI family DNA-binding transcriptional regulator [Virgibacillus siamensis]|uniref:LacI family DNA-binding transcriptional regulator n=1 Tax=Virgibacillus siamensis TaxID=480071 RepID=UPI000985A94E|nr:LacI family DNA-binding transcriptional regulator [Virgibacillus siamensis]